MVAADHGAECSRRAFTIGDGHEPTLLPVIDMANHDADDPAALIEKTEAGEFQVRTTLRVWLSKGLAVLTIIAGRLTQLVATRDITEGDAVTISYGDLSNAQVVSV